ncbi:MAG: hypothetical protein M3540_06440 [Actinomycetota bacterium]|nr:hypothetical protein [Actinomycetota bacterium]
MGRAGDKAEAADAATFAYHAFPLYRLQARNRIYRDPPLARLEVVHESGSVRIVLAHVMVVARLLLQQPLRDQEVDRVPGCVRPDEERAAVDLAQDRVVHFHEWVGTNNLEVEDDSFSR